MSEGVESAPRPDELSRIGRFIGTYQGFLSTFVIGAAGLIATSLWQYRQSEIALRQAESQRAIAGAQAENNWRIERARILSQNLQVLGARGEASVEQRYGVLLSLTRGNILDPELAVSYALELGKDNPDDMKSVLANTADKNYTRLVNAFEPTCLQRFGVARDVPLCRPDKLAERSGALAELVSDELELPWSREKPGPMALLADERDVQSTPTRLCALFTPYLNELYDRRQTAEIGRFEDYSKGAHLVSALVLGPWRQDELVGPGEASDLEKFHAERDRWLLDYVAGAVCNRECKSRVLDYLVTRFSESTRDLAPLLRGILLRPRTEVAPAIARLNTRLLLCEVSAPGITALRDQLFVPLLTGELNRPAPDPSRLDDLAGLLALVPAPAAGAPQTWNDALNRLRERARTTYQRAYVESRAAAEAHRASPPPSLRKAMFCHAAEFPAAAPDLGEQ